jgi:hypothetical protein
MTASNRQTSAPENGHSAMANDSKPIFGKDGRFKSSVPPGAVRPKPVSVPEKKK